MVSASNLIGLSWGWWFESDCEHRWSTGVSVVDALLRVRAYAAPGSLSRMYNKLYTRVKWWAAHCSEVSDEFSMDYTSLSSLAWYLHPSILVIGCTAVGIRSKTIEIKLHDPLLIKLIDISSSERDRPKVNCTMIAPHVQMLGSDAAVVSYTRLVQCTNRYRET